MSTIKIAIAWLLDELKDYLFADSIGLRELLVIVLLTLVLKILARGLRRLARSKRKKYKSQSHLYWELTTLILLLRLVRGALDSLWTGARKGIAVGISDIPLSGAFPMIELHCPGLAQELENVQHSLDLAIRGADDLRQAQLSPFTDPIERGRLLNIAFRRKREAIQLLRDVEDKVRALLNEFE